MPQLTRKNGISIYYEVIGPVEATETILLLGGLSRDHTIWRKVVPLLENKYRIILPDNRDAGQSSVATTEYDISQLAEDMSDLIEALKTGPVHVIGHSMGGFMALHLAATYPQFVKSIALCSTAEKQTKTGIAYLTERIRLINEKPSDQASPANREDIVAVMDKIYSPNSLTNTALIEEIIQFETSNPYPQAANSFKRQAIACVKHDAESLLNDIHSPAIIITGEHDRSFPPEIAYALAEKIADSTVTVIPSAGHPRPDSARSNGITQATPLQEDAGRFPELRKMRERQ